MGLTAPPLGSLKPERRLLDELIILKHGVHVRAEAAGPRIHDCGEAGHLVSDHLFAGTTENLDRLTVGHTSLKRLVLRGGYRALGLLRGRSRSDGQTDGDDRVTPYTLGERGRIG